MLRTKIFIALVFISFLCFSGRALVQGGNGPKIIQWPSEDYPTIQEAIDDLQDGDELEIASGEFMIEEPIYVIGKEISIKGAGSGLDAGPNTHLIGRPPRPVLDEDNNVILPAEEAVGLFNFIDSDVTIQNMWISGFDSGIVVLADYGHITHLLASKVLVTDTGRGILFLSPGDYTVRDCAIRSTLWHGIVSTTPSWAPEPQDCTSCGEVIENTIISYADGAGIYSDRKVGTTIVLFDDIEHNSSCGIVCNQCNALNVYDSNIRSNDMYGIFIFEAPSTAYIHYNNIDWNSANWWWPDTGCPYNGDGIISYGSPLDVLSNSISHNERAAVLNAGSVIQFVNNEMWCNWRVEPYAGNHVFYDYPYCGSPPVWNESNNVCGCPEGNTYICKTVGASVAPPAPLPAP